MTLNLNCGICLALASVVLAALGSCSDPDAVDQDSSPKETSTDEDLPAEEQGAIIGSGFGQGNDEYVWVTALVENQSDHGGQTVTVSFNVKDDSGEVVATTQQVESFSWPGQKLAVGTQVDLEPRVRAESVDATLLVEDENSFGESSELPIVKGTVAKNEFGGNTAKFRIENSASKPLKDPRIGIICEAKNGDINGGTSEYPEFIPPNGEIALTADVITSGKPAECTAYVGPSI
jgi:hypothetical protein